MNIPANIIAIWNGTHASIPSGWSRETSLDGLFIKGAPASTNPNSTGGAATHTHTSPNHAHTLASHTHTYQTSSDQDDSGGKKTSDGAGGYSNDIFNGTHYHTGTSGTSSGGTTANTAVTYGAFSNNPPFHEVIFVKSSGAGSLLNEMIALYADTSAPSGWYACDGNNSTPNLVDKYLRGAGTSQNAGTTGGTTTNVHDISHTHTTTAHTHSGATSGQQQGTRNNVDNINSGSGSPDAPYWSHTHTVALTNGTQDITAYSSSLTTAETVEPVYKKVLAIQNRSGVASRPKKVILLWLGTNASIPQGWFLCDGSNGTPDLRDYYPKITATTGHIGNTGGSNTHTHAAQAHGHSGATTHSHSGTVSNHPADVEGRNTDVHSYYRVGYSPEHTLSSVSSTTANYENANTTADSSSNEPEYRTVAFIQYQFDAGGSFLYNFL